MRRGVLSAVSEPRRRAGARPRRGAARARCRRPARGRGRGRAAAREQADARAWEVYQLLEGGKRIEAEAKLAALGELPLSRTERAILAARVHETRVMAVDAALKGAAAAFKAGRQAEVIAPLEAALVTEPTGPRAVLARYYLGIAYAKASQLEKAIAHLQAAVDGDTDQEDARFQLASALDRSGAYEARARRVRAVRHGAPAVGPGGVRDAARRDAGAIAAGGAERRGGRRGGWRSPAGAGSACGRRAVPADARTGGRCGAVPARAGAARGWCAAAGGAAPGEASARSGAALPPPAAGAPALSSGAWTRCDAGSWRCDAACSGHAAVRGADVGRSGTGAGGPGGPMTVADVPGMRLRVLIAKRDPRLERVADVPGMRPRRIDRRPASLVPPARAFAASVGGRR